MWISANSKEVDIITYEWLGKCIPDDNLRLSSVSISDFPTPVIPRKDEYLVECGFSESHKTSNALPCDIRKMDSL